VTPIIDKKLLYNSQLKHVGVANVAISVQIIEMKLTKNAYKTYKNTTSSSVLGRHLFYADPEPTFRFDDDPYPDPHPFPSFTLAAKTEKLWNFIR
jgi:hypothetical protein